MKLSAKAVAAGFLAAAAIAAGVAVGCKLASDPEVRYRFMRSARDAYETSKKKVATMSEDVAVRTAQMTKNPKINQEWVAHQWENVGY